MRGGQPADFIVWVAQPPMHTTSPTSSAHTRPPRTRRFLRLGLPPAAFAPIIDARHAVEAVDRRDRRYRHALALSDMLAIAVAALGAAGIPGDPTLRPATLLLLPAIVIAAKAYGLYDRDGLLLNKTTIDEAPQLFQLATLSALGISLCDSVLFGASISTGGVVMVWALLLAVMVLGRRAARAIVRGSVSVERCVFVGDAPAAERLRAKLEGAAKAELVGRMPLPARREVDAEQALRGLLDASRAHRVVIDPQALPDNEMLDLVRTAKSLGVRVSLLPGIHDVVGSEVVFDNLQGMTLLGVRRFGLSRSSLLLKRGFDLVGACAMLLAAGPAMAVIALAIKLDSPGPVFFRQTRVGRGGRHFKIYKFRTMVVDAEARKAQLRIRNEAHGLFKIAEDPRITRVGRLLRKTSLDELAQLLNVFRGDMSLVGPRPLVLDEDAMIADADRGRLHLTPGMTGHWQIAGSSRIPMHEMVKIDYLYVAGWSLWSDVKILLRTLPYMLARRGL
jgi:exopolysaccharide biosynthesis polyprenyl glycosylphosphotransferase